MPSTLPIRTNLLRQLWCKPMAHEELAYFFKTSTLPRAQLFSRPRNIPYVCRQFSHTPIQLKKKGRAEREKEEQEASSKSGEDVEDPFDFSTLESGISTILERLKNELSKLRTGGRFNPEVLENLKVYLNKDIKRSEKLKDLAQVLPKGGRSLIILAGERDHIKPITSAIQGSKDLNLQPQPDAQNPSQLNVPIPPPTKESRDQALAVAVKAGGAATMGIRNARATMQKRLRSMELRKVVRPDDLKRAHKEMEKVVDKGLADVGKTTDVARKAMEQA